MVPSLLVLPGVLMMTLTSTPLVTPLVEAFVETRCALLDLPAEECLRAFGRAVRREDGLAGAGANCFRNVELLFRKLLDLRTKILGVENGTNLLAFLDETGNNRAD